jgi:hypothetical protein
MLPTMRMPCFLPECRSVSSTCRTPASCRSQA